MNLFRMGFILISQERLAQSLGLPDGTQIIGVEKVTGVGDFRVVVSHDDIPEYVGGAARTLLKPDERGWNAQRVTE